ncbi:MAG: SDR family oxidoreductase [Ignavibacteria bacterium]|nr:SDR family oxidoreductase [Ignavibacteria bacterium]
MNETAQVKTVLITGATSGIGLEFAKVCAGLNYNIIAIGKDPGKLNSLKSELEGKFFIKVDTVKADLSNTEEVLKLSDYVDSFDTGIDILINNAGTGVYGEFKDTDFTKELSLINVNVVALSYITKIILKKMLRRGKGKILNVASTAAFKPGPLMAVYYASKAYVLSFSVAVAREIKDTGVSLTVLCPGPVNTKLLKESTHIELQFIDYEKMSDPEDIAIAGMKALERNEIVTIPGFRNKLNAFLVKLIPSKVLMDILYRSKKNSLKQS